MPKEHTQQAQSNVSETLETLIRARVPKDLWDYPDFVRAVQKAPADLRRLLMGTHSMQTGRILVNHDPQIADRRGLLDHDTVADFVNMITIMQETNLPPRHINWYD